MLLKIRYLLAALCLIASATHATPAPDFSLKTQSGDPLSLTDQRGKVVMINFWASWCPPCLKEMPLLDEIYNTHKDNGFTLLGINIEQDTTEAKRLIKELDLSFPILFDPNNQVGKQYNVRAMPTTVVVDQTGTVRFVNHGYRPGDEEKYEAQVRELIGE
jgi:peroxiredoxin